METGAENTRADIDFKCRRGECVPNLRGASPVGRDNRGRSYAALTIGGGELSRRVVVEAGFPAQRGRPVTSGRAGR